MRERQREREKVREYAGETHYLMFTTVEAYIHEVPETCLYRLNVGQGGTYECCGKLLTGAQGGVSSNPYTISK